MATRKVAKAATLKNMRINEISLVDRGANQHANVLLCKRAGSGAQAAAAVAAASTPYWKRDFTQAQRDAAEKAGHAMPGGAFPIETVSDLKNAIQAIGRAKDPTAAKAHIKQQAARLGCSDLVPEDWAKRKDGALHAVKLFRASSINFGKARKADYSGLPLAEIQAHVADLAKALACIAKNEDIAAADQAGEFVKQFKSFKTHIRKLAPQGVEKAMQAAAVIAAGCTVDTQGAIVVKGNSQMSTLHTTTADINKLMSKLAKRDDKIEKLESDLKSLKSELRIAKMSAPHQDYHKTLSGDAADKFAAMDASGRDDYMAKNPISKNLPQWVQDLQKRDAEQAEQLAELRKREVESVFAKRATDLGLPAEFGKTLAKVADDDALKEIERVIKSLTAQQDTAVIFKEFGTAQGGSTSPVAVYEAKVEELTKSGITKAQAIVKIAEEPQYRELFANYRKAISGNRAAA